MYSDYSDNIKIKFAGMHKVVMIFLSFRTLRYYYVLKQDMNIIKRLLNSVLNKIYWFKDMKHLLLVLLDSLKRSSKDYIL